jgi:hypothetical protein
MPVITMPARQCGKSFAADVQARLLNALFDTGHAMSITELETQLRVTRRDLWTAIRAQALLGNIRKGQPLELTASARVAIQAGRSALTQEAAA